MRAFEFLLEYNQQITARSFGKQLLQVAQKDPDAMKLLLIPNDDIEDPSEDDDVVTLLTAFEAADASGSKMDNVPWMVKRYIAGDFKFNQLPQVTAILTDFMTIKPRLKGLGVSIDLNQYTVIGLRDKLKDLNSTDIDIDGDGKPIDIGIPDVKVLYHGPLGKLYMPLTEEASCELGAGTKWCTAATITKNHFNDYTKEGLLIIWIDKSKKRFQFSIRILNGKNSFEIKNATNNSPPSETLSYFRNTHLVLKQVMAYIEKHIVHEPPSAILYLKLLAGGRWPEAEPEILKSPEFAVKYVTQVMNGERWPEAELILLDAENRKDALEYAERVIKGPWPEAEILFISHPWSIVSYAKNCLKKRWYKAEPAMMTDIKSCVDYAASVIQGPWPEVEPKILREGPNLSLDYAVRAIKGRWSKAEDYINSTTNAKIEPRIFTEYMKYKNIPWPEAERMVIFDFSDHSLVLYAAKVLQSRWPAYEKAAIELPSSEFYDMEVGNLVDYAAKLMKNDRWPAKVEEQIARFGNHSSVYVSYVIKDRWPEAEESIMEVGGFYATMYAIDGLKRRWPEAEPNMFSEDEAELDEELLFKYLKDYRKSRWPEFESFLEEMGIPMDKYNEIMAELGIDL